MANIAGDWLSNRPLERMKRMNHLTATDADADMRANAPVLEKKQIARQWFAGFIHASKRKSLIYKQFFVFVHVPLLAIWFRLERCRNAAERLENAINQPDAIRAMPLA